MTGSAFENENTGPTDLAGLSNLNLIFKGGADDVDPFEIGGKDLGPVMEGLDDNFALGTLTLGGSAGIGQIDLVDSFDNQPDWTGDEALYVYCLNIGPGSSLDLNTYSLYYLDGSIDASAFIDESGGGRLIRLGETDVIPEPGTLILLGGGLLAVARRRRKR